MNTQRMAVVSLGLILWLCASAPAGIVDFRYWGTVTTVTDPNGSFDPSIVQGAAFSGSLFYDPDVLVDMEPGEPTLGDYRPATPMSVRVGNVDSTSPGFLAIVADNRPWDDGMGGSGLQDTFAAINAAAFSSLGLDVIQMALLLKDNGGAVFDDDGLPVPADMLAIGDFPDEASFLLVGSDPDFPSQTISILGTVDLIDVVPEPSTLGLCIAASLCLRRRRRQLAGP